MINNVILFIYYILHYLIHIIIYIYLFICFYLFVYIKSHNINNNMSLRKHTDYGSYLTNLKYNNLGNYLSDKNLRLVEARIDEVQSSVSVNDTANKPQNVYISQSPNMAEISLENTNTMIMQPTDSFLPNIFTVLRLPANNTIENGTSKTIINTCEISQTKLVYIYSVNTDTNAVGFSTLFNCYVFPCAGDTLELYWNSDKQNWLVKKYGGYFMNLNI